MKFDCPCGNTLSDNTDNLPSKAHALADQDVDLFMGELEAVLDRLVLSLGGAEVQGWKGARGAKPIEAKSSLENAAKMLLWQVKSKFLKRTLYQCEGCQRLLIDVDADAMRTFLPDEPARSERILGSALGELYPVVLSGNWSSARSKGDLFWNTSGSNEGGFEDFTELGALQARYFQVLDQLQGEKRLRSAQLRDGETVIHQWP